MTTIRFDPTTPQVIVQGSVHGPAGVIRVVDFLIDTGTAHTVIDTSILDALGFGAHLAIGRSSLWGVSGSTNGYVVRVPSILVVGRTLKDYRIAAHDFPPELGIDALLGLDFFQGGFLGLDFAVGELTVR